MSTQEPLPEDIQTAIDQLAEHRTVTVREDVQEVIDIAKAVQAAGMFNFISGVHSGNNDVFRAAIQVRFGPMSW